MITDLRASLLWPEKKMLPLSVTYSELGFLGLTVQNMADEKLASSSLRVCTECSFSFLQALHFPGKELSLKVGQTHGCPNPILAHVKSFPMG